jgi:hypothetical protein
MGDNAAGRALPGKAGGMAVFAAPCGYVTLILRTEDHYGDEWQFLLE